MKIIDCHCGIGPWSLRDRLLPYKPREMLELMDHFGVDQALVHANYVVGAGGSPGCGNRILADACRDQPRFIPAASTAPTVHADNPQLAEYFEQLRQLQARALWLVARSAGAVVEIYSDLFGRCVDARLPLLVDRADLGPGDLFAIMDRFPELRVILCGASYGEDYLLFRLLRRYPNFHVSLGHFYIPPGNPDRFLEEFPAERLIFGSGLPHFSPGGLIGHVMFARASTADKALILGGNLERLMQEVAL